MAKKKRVFQVAERIKEIVAEVLTRTADPRFSLVTITSAYITPDLRQAKIYWVTSMADSSKREERFAEVDEAFETAAGLFRRQIGKELGIKFVPALKFYYDDTLDTVEEVERLFQKARANSGSGE